MKYKVINIEEDIDFGCEERTDGQQVQAVVTLKDADGNIFRIKQPDKMLYDKDINIGDDVILVNGFLT